MAVRSALDVLTRRPVLTASITAALGLGIPIITMTTPEDLQVYLAGGHAALGDVPLYSPAVQVNGYGFTYPPFAALLFAGLQLLPRAAATGLLTVATLGALAVVLGVSFDGPRRAVAVGRRLGRSDGRVMTPLVLTGVMIGVAYLEPVRQTVWNGQVNLVLAALVLLDLFRPASVGRRGLGGVLIGLATAVKLTPGLFIVYLLLAGRRADAARAAATGVAAAALAAVILPDDSARFWTHEIFGNPGIGDPGSLANQSVWGLLDHVGLRGPALVVGWPAGAVTVAALGLVVAVRLTARGERVLAAGLLGITSCLVSPVSWTHHWVWVVVIAGGLTQRLVGPTGEWRRRTGGAPPRWPIGPWGLGGLTAVAVVFMLGPDRLPLSVLEHWGPGRLIVGNAFVLLGVAALAVSARSRERTAPAQLWEKTQPSGAATSEAVGILRT